ncbi:hypothetical protein EVAR_8064_1 [Eumeta japonica]|uniref:Uncharacterized protein n=1 Tax=Eumeta variegata TaxID=151549 RepID=A0A4C1TH68_EUMVA|nr:hypothetical protein EVAR_8064_1 [Eumeta japonica]
MVGSGGGRAASPWRRERGARTPAPPVVMEKTMLRRLFRGHALTGGRRLISTLDVVAEALMDVHNDILVSPYFDGPGMPFQLVTYVIGTIYSVSSRCNDRVRAADGVGEW